MAGGVESRPTAVSSVVLQATQLLPEAETPNLAGLRGSFSALLATLPSRRCAGLPGATASNCTDRARGGSMVYLRSAVTASHRLCRVSFQSPAFSIV